MSQKKPVLVLGGGVSGLFAAYHAVRAGHSVRIYEKEARVGGLVQTLHFDWGLVETAANGLFNSQPLEEFYKEIDLEILRPLKENKKRFIFRNGKPRRWPLSFGESVRLGARLFSSRRTPLRHESLLQFANRVYGDSAARYLIEPAVLGVFGAQAQDLSANSVYRYFFTSPRNPPVEKEARGTVAPKDGMGALVDCLRQYLEKKGVRFVYRQHVLDLDEIPKEEGEILVLALPAREAARVLRSSRVDEELSQDLENIQYRPLTTATVAYANEKPLKGFGCLFPRDQDFFAYGVLFNTCIFNHRANVRTETWILPGVEDSADETLATVHRDACRLHGENVTFSHSSVTTWAEALPLYNIQHEVFLEKYESPWGYLGLENANQRIFLVGNYLGPIGLTKMFESSGRMVKEFK